MKTFALSSFLLMSGFAAFGQNSSDLFDKAPPAIDEALRARVNKFYELFIAGKFKDAYSLVADDSQDKFFELSKDQYKSCRNRQGQLFSELLEGDGGDKLQERLALARRGYADNIPADQ